MRGRWRWIMVAVFVAAVGVAEVSAAPIDAFFGRFAGHSLSEGDGNDVAARDFDVDIRPIKTGAFQIAWTTTVRDGGTTREKRYVIDFESTRRGGIYASQMRENMFGDRVPLDPMNGDPLVWARIVDDTLTVYALLITESGSYEMQIYERTLVPDGLRLTFQRLREGEAVRVVRGFLKRQ